MNWFYNILIGFGSIMIGMVGFTEEISRKIRFLRAINSLIIKISFFLLGSLIILFASIQKDNDSDYNNEVIANNYEIKIKELDSTYRNERRTSDSLHEKIIRELLDSSYIKSLKASNEALAKYNLVFIDSLHNVANTINVKAVLSQLTISSVENNKPPIYIDEKNNQKTLNIKFMSSKATSYNINLNLYLCKMTEKEYKIIYHKNDIFSDDNFLVPDRFRTIQFYLDSTIIQEESIEIIILGTFSRDDKGKDNVEFKQVFAFNVKDNHILIKNFRFNYEIFKTLLKKNKLL